MLLQASHWPLLFHSSGPHWCNLHLVPSRLASLFRQDLHVAAPAAGLAFPVSHDVQVEEEVAAVAELLERAWD
jgi:hypothetical protein